MSGRRSMRSATAAPPTPLVSQPSDATLMQSPRTPTQSPRQRERNAMAATGSAKQNTSTIANNKRPAPPPDHTPNVVVKKTKKSEEDVSPVYEVVDLGKIENIPKETIDFLHAAKNTRDWCGRARRVVNQLFWVKRTVSAKERNALFEILLPACIHTGAERKQCKSYFDSTMNYSLQKFRKVIEEIGEAWIASKAGVAFISHIKSEEAKRKGSVGSVKAPSKFSASVEPPSTPSEVLSFMGFPGIQWTKYHAIDALRRWLVFLDTESAPEKHIGWLVPTAAQEEDKNNTSTHETFHLQAISNAILSSVVVYLRAEALFPGSLVTKSITNSIREEQYGMRVDHWPRILDDQTDYSNDVNTQLELPAPYAGSVNIPDDVHDYDQESLFRAPRDPGDEDEIFGDDESDAEIISHKKVATRLQFGPGADVDTPIAIKEEEDDLHDQFLSRLNDDDTYIVDRSGNMDRIIKEATLIQNNIELRISDEMKKDGIFYEPIQISRHTARSIASPYISRYAEIMSSLDPVAQAAVQLDAIAHRQTIIGAESFRLHKENERLDALKDRLQDELRTAQQMQDHIKELKSKTEAKKLEIQGLQGEISSVKSKEATLISKPSFFTASFGIADYHSYGSYKAFNASAEQDRARSGSADGTGSTNSEDTHPSSNTPITIPTAAV